VIHNIDKTVNMSIMRITMPARPPETTRAAAEKLIELGKQIRAHRKSLRVSAVAVAESAGMSRVTLHRIERGEPSVTVGAYLNAMTALGMELNANGRPDSFSNAEIQDKQGWIPARINLDNYPQLKQLAWQVQGTNELKPAEALGIYERNWRHVEASALEPQEQNLIDALRLAFGGEQRDN
jgi:transcriptional regulator with XRE-family HTH domain